MFLHLCTPLVLVIFYNLSIRKLVFHRSHGINFNTFCAWFFDFISSVIFVRIFLTFEAILVSIWHHFSEKNCSENGYEKRGPIHQNRSLWTCPEAPREAASRAHFSNKKHQFEHKFQKLLLELMSCPRKCCFNLFPLQFFQKCSKKWKESMSNTHYWLSDTPNLPKAWRFFSNVFGKNAMETK